MAKLKDRKLYKKGILKLKLGGEVPASPFTMKGLNQAGISALNTIKNPASMAKGLGMRTLGVMGLTNPYTAPFVAPMMMYSVADALTPQSVKDRAELKRLVEGEYPGIMDYDEIPENRSTVDLLKEAKKLNKDFPLVKRLSEQFPEELADKNKLVKKDDRETGVEVVEQGGSKMKPKLESDISNRNPQINNQDAQQLVYDQKKQLKNADKVFDKMKETALTEPGKMTALRTAMEAAKDVMGERGYNKSGRLLLLQVAANLLSGKTEQQGVRGFLDVLGQAGKNVIPMALALEREREKDELELTKLLLQSNKKQTKIKPPSLKIRYRLPNGEISDPAPASETDDGNYLVYENIPGQGSVRVIVSPDQITARADIQDNQTIKAKLLNQYKTFKSGEMFTNTFLDVARNDPSLIAGTGGLKNLLYSFYEAKREVTGGKDYRDTILKMTNDQRSLLDTDSDIDPEARKELNDIFSEVEKMTTNIDEVSEDIQKQSLLKTLQLLSTYSLAQTLKREDRLAVKDIERAEKQLANIMSINPFTYRGALDIISSYKVVNEQFTSRLNDIRSEWDNNLFDPGELINLDKNYAGSKESEAQKNINNFTQNFDTQNDQDMDMFNKMFNKDNLRGIISQ